MEHNLGMMSVSLRGPKGQERGRGIWRGGSEPSPRLLQGLRNIVTSPGLGQILLWCIFWDLNFASETV